MHSSPGWTPAARTVQMLRTRPRWRGSCCTSDMASTSRKAVLAAALLMLGGSVGGVDRDRQLERPVPLDRHVSFTATAYCDAGTTKSGVHTRSGIVAADPQVLPVGSVVRLRSPEVPRYEGIYTVMDTGSAVQGNRIDLYVASCREAKEFGLKQVLVRVLRMGWNPRASAPSAGAR